MNESKEYIYQLSFIDENDEIIPFEMSRFVTDEFSAVLYVEDWLNKFESNYGYCFQILIYSEDNPYNILLNIERDFY